MSAPRHNSRRPRPRNSRGPGPRSVRHAAGPQRGAAPTRARALALRVLERVTRAGAYADLALAAALRGSGLAPRDRAFATELVYGTLRWRGRIDYLLRAVLNRPLEDLEALLATLLRMGAYQILFCDGVPHSAAVDQSVRCARATGAGRGASLVNAALRQLARRAPSLPLPRLAEDPLGHLEHALSLPRWLAERWLSLLGPTEAAALAAASNQPAPLVARINPLRTTRAGLLRELRQRIPLAAPCRYAAHGIVLGHAGHPAHDPAFLDGRMSVQDEAAQLVVDWLAPRRGERVLDLCAAPGGKTAAIAERVGPKGLVVAVDRHPGRLALIGRSCRRLGLGNVTSLLRDATGDLGDLPGAPFDRVLVDAPCSGLGALRRNPDARWRLRPGDPARLAQVQSAMLARAAPLLRPGGALLYSVCTLLPEENEAVAAGLPLKTSRRVPAALRPLVDPDGFMRTWPHRHGADGFFAARFEQDA